jgi:hypothetical protein
LLTIGCGVIENGVGEGTIESASTAHNWQFTANHGGQLMISLKNDGKSCPNILLLDANGKAVEGFSETNNQPSCLEGMLSTTNYFFRNPVAGKVYLIRVITPCSPGAYWLKIE